MITEAVQAIREGKTWAGVGPRVFFTGVLLFPFLVTVFLFAAPAAAQQAYGQAGAFQQQQEMRRERQMERRGLQRRGLRMDRHHHQPGFFDRLRDLPLEKQERVLANDARFQKLPPQRQEKIRQNLRRWNSLPPQKKQLIREREEIVQSLSPAQRRDLRSIFPQYRRLPPRQRTQVNEAFRKLRRLPTKRRESFLASPEVQELSPQQRQVLEGLARLLPR